MKYHFRVHREKRGGFWAECVELKGCLTQGDTMDGLVANMQEVLSLFLDEPEDSRLVFTLPKKRVQGKNIIAVPVSPRVAFSFAMRRIRLLNRLTQRQAADRIGLSGSLTTYQRLEKSSTANPEFETIVKIKRAFPELALDELAKL